MGALSPALFIRLISLGLLKAGAQCAPYNCTFQTGSEGTIINYQIIELSSIFIIPRPVWDEVENPPTSKNVDSIAQKPLRYILNHLQ